LGRYGYDHGETGGTELSPTGGQSGLDAIRIVHNDDDTFGFLPGETDKVSLGAGAGGFGGSWANVSSYAYNTVSDARQKDNIRDLDYGIEEVMNLRAVRYQWENPPEYRISNMSLILSTNKTDPCSSASKT
jgi:hypothetical protein